MLEPKQLREHPDAVKESLRKRQMADRVHIVDEWVALDKEWREVKGETDQLRSRRNKVSEEINAARKAKKPFDKLVKEAKDIPASIAKNDERMAELDRSMTEILQRIPNILDASVPVGKDETGNKVEAEFGKKPAVKNPLSHVDIIEKQGWVDLDRAAKLSGARWYFLQGELARLELALVTYAVDLLTKTGFTLTIPPFALGDKAYASVCDIGTFKDEIYHLEGEGLSLIATSEHPLTALYMDESLDASQLPIKRAGLSQCFRKEAGAHGKDQKGIFRVHQFQKVEMVCFALPDQSAELHKQMLDVAKKLFDSLGLHGRLVSLCSGDMGHVAAKTIDIEVWFPAQKAYREVVSCSNCTTYQSAGLGTRYQKGEERGFVHTLNSTMVATTRALVAIMENCQNPDGTITVPKVLHPYMGGAKTIGTKIR